MCILEYFLINICQSNIHTCCCVCSKFLLLSYICSCFFLGFIELPPKPFFGGSNRVKVTNIFCHVIFPTHSCWVTLYKNSYFTLSVPNKNYKTKTSLCWMQVVEHGCRNQKLLPWCIFYTFTCFSSVFSSVFSWRLAFSSGFHFTLVWWPWQEETFRKFLKSPSNWFTLMKSCLL